MTDSQRRVLTVLLAVAVLAGVPDVAAGSGPPAARGGTPGPSSRDAAMERVLLEGRVVSIEEIGSGVTKPRRVVLEFEGRRYKAAFKSLDVHKPGVTKFEDGSVVAAFTDSYRYERAAYLLDRRVGLDMVPVVVLRQIGEQAGALVEWVEDATSEAQRMAVSQAVPEELRLQQNLMHVFDELIANDDRHESNQLITRDGRLRLIDHSRCFRTRHGLSDAFLNRPVGVTAEMLRNLESLDARDLRGLLRGLLSRPQIAGLLSRRDRILRKVEADRKEYGDRFVIQDPRGGPEVSGGSSTDDP